MGVKGWENCGCAIKLLAKLGGGGAVSIVQCHIVAVAGGEEGQEVDAQPGVWRCGGNEPGAVHVILVQLIRRVRKDRLGLAGREAYGSQSATHLAGFNRDKGIAARVGVETANAQGGSLALLKINGRRGVPVAVDHRATGGRGI